MDWDIDRILKATEGRMLCGQPVHSFNGIGIDSRTIEPSKVFVAIRGDRFDGHDFVEKVVEDGIKCVVVEENAMNSDLLSAIEKKDVVCIGVSNTILAIGALARHQRSLLDIPVVAITGSNGKTTTRRLTSAVVSTTFNTLATQGNLNNEIGLPLTLFNLHSNHQAAVLELGMNHFGEISRLGAICRPTIGLITNVGSAHLEFLDSLEGVAQAKAELIGQIDPQGTVILNADDDRVAAMAARAGERRVIYFGISGNAAIRAKEIKDSKDGLDFKLIIEDSSIDVHLKAGGHFMVFNSLAAAAVGWSIGIDAARIKQGLESYRQTKGRMSVIRTLNQVTLIDDTYNANPSSMAVALETMMARTTGGSGILVVGDMYELGERATDFHRELGGKAAMLGVSRLYACGDHAEHVAEGAMAAGMPAADIIIGSKEDVAADLIQRTKPGDRILVKGSRAMAMETVVEAIVRDLGKMDD